MIVHTWKTCSMEWLDKSLSLLELHPFPSPSRLSYTRFPLARPPLPGPEQARRKGVLAAHGARARTVVCPMGIQVRGAGGIGSTGKGAAAQWLPSGGAHTRRDARPALPLRRCACADSASQHPPARSHDSEAPQPLSLSRAPQARSQGVTVAQSPCQ